MLFYQTLKETAYLNRLYISVIIVIPYFKSPLRCFIINGLVCLSKRTLLQTEALCVANQVITFHFSQKVWNFLNRNENKKNKTQFSANVVQPLSVYFGKGGSQVGHFTVVCSVTWSMNATKAGGDLALIQTSLFFIEQWFN